MSALRLPPRRADRNAERYRVPLVPGLRAPLLGRELRHRAAAGGESDLALTHAAPSSPVSPPQLCSGHARASDVAATQRQAYPLTWTFDPVCHRGMSA